MKKAKRDDELTRVDHEPSSGHMRIIVTDVHELRSRFQWKLENKNTEQHSATVVGLLSLTGT